MVKEKIPLPFEECIVPIYYHWFAVVLRDAFKDPVHDGGILKDYISKIPPDALNIAVERFMVIKNKQQSENEYKCSSLVQNTLNHFIIDKEIHLKAACLSQYPVYKTGRTDFSVRCLNHHFPTARILDSDYKPYNLENAIKETVCYHVNANEGNKTFSWSFGLPCTSQEMVLFLHLPANRTVLTIEVARVEIGTTVEFRNFLTILYAAIHWRVNNMETTDTPSACEPIKGLILRDNFPDHPSTRVFYNKEKETVYKIFENGGTKFTNVDLMSKLGYFDNLTLENIGKSHQLLSYKFLKGTTVPVTKRHIDEAKKVIEHVHSLGYVHADVRIGNIVFSPLSQSSTAYLIDFDFAAKVGGFYHELYNESLSERHPDAKRGHMKQCDHDLHSLQKIAECYGI